MERIGGGEKEQMIIMGLNSGTSKDGVSAVLFKRVRLFPRAKVKVIKEKEFAYPGWLLKRMKEVIAKGGIEEVARLNFLLGEFFSECALRLIKQAGIKKDRIDFIASHGQTVGHFPRVIKIRGYNNRASLQLAEPSVIAERTGITTVGDFRAGDIASGGQGAPVLAYPEFLLFSSKEKNRMVLNLGGISNFSLLAKDEGADKVLATDCGPCNLLLEELAEAVMGERVDKNGEWALRGKARRGWVRRFLAHKFFERKAPKSTGEEEFNKDWVKGIIYGFKWGKKKDRWDVLRSGVCAVAEMIGKAYYENYSDFRLEQVIVSGGSARNRALVLELERIFGRRMILSEELGIGLKAKEPIGFGLLGELCLLGLAGNLALATGAKKEAILGKIVPGKNWGKLLSKFKRGE